MTTRRTYDPRELLRVAHDTPAPPVRRLGWGDQLFRMAFLFLMPAFPAGLVGVLLVKVAQWLPQPWGTWALWGAVAFTAFGYGVMLVMVMLAMGSSDATQQEEAHWKARRVARYREN
jgi:hypothetical protein